MDEGNQGTRLARTLDLLGRPPMTVESALQGEEDVLVLASYKSLTEQLYRELWQQRLLVEEAVRHHLALCAQDKCVVLPPNAWLRGSFNACVLVEVRASKLSGQVIFRCPMPHKLPERTHPGSVNEKLSSEVGAYVWVEEHCPEIRVPVLYGFGFLDGQQFTHKTCLPWYTRAIRYMWRTIYNIFRLQLLSNYIKHPSTHTLHSAYMVLEYIGPETGHVLSDTFEQGREDGARMQRLYQGISQILLSLARVPRSQIGSLRFSLDGTVALTNRPLLCSTAIAEGSGAPRIIPTNDTFACTEAFVSDVLTFHDNRFLNQPNAVYDEPDCRGQMATKTVLRALSHRYVKRELRYGPFLLQLDDLHASNIMVDQEWNAVALIDLEWICALPAEMLHVPYWLTGCSIDGIQGAELDQFNQVRQDFLRVFAKEEEYFSTGRGHNISLTALMQETWDSKGVWFWHCLSSTNAMYLLVEPYLCPPSALCTDAEKLISCFWNEDSDRIVCKKIADMRAYHNQVRKLFDG
ncbi:hypothetical protein FZEAL_5552 [Fusarium zealandicum]|uniref:Aminoglycoside phosphotransferase domain-containing protein n=1 Tax=Fusarium zealandicum TaxID=1053134 RepID=A0A8H4UJL9_9HYPO|nr:hypothetical protein FZEAL_5552 [Fusarium zealandicum]